MNGLATAVAIVLSVATSATANDPAPTIQLPGATFNVPLPEGYCVATGRFDGVAKILASLDTLNLTDITYVACSDITSGSVHMSSWGMIKTPLETLRENVGPRDVLIAQLKAAVNQDEGKKVLEITNDQLARDTNLNKVFGPDFKGSAKFDAMDFDQYGVYYGGVGNYDDGKGGIYKVACAYSITAANGRAFMIYLYRPYNDVRDIAALLAVIKTETSAFIAANGG